MTTKREQELIDFIRTEGLKLGVYISPESACCFAAIMEAVYREKHTPKPVHPSENIGSI